MRILQVGDLAGIGYKLNSVLNETDGIDAQLLICARSDRCYPGREARNVRQIPYMGGLGNLRLYGNLLNARGKFDVYHSHSLMAPMLLASCRPFVASFHGSDVREVAGSRTAMGAALRRSMRSAEYVLYTTVELGPMIRALGVDEERTVWLPAPIDTSRFAPGPTDVDLGQGSKFAIFLPQPLVDVRRPHLFFEAFARVAAERPDVHLSWIAHPRTAARNQEMRELLETAGVAAQTTMLTPIPPPDMVGYYRAADAVADWFNADLPAVSQTALEAMACGRPVIMSLPTDSENYLNSSGALPGNNVGLIESSLRRLVDAPQLRVQSGSTGREWVREYHDMPKVGRQLVAIYQSL